MIEFFGDPWPSGICDEGRQVTTPINDDCELCGEGICDQDQGSFMFGLDGQKKPVHRECSLRSVMGGIGHWNNHVAWCIDRHDPDGGYSYRESALMVWDLIHELGFNAEYSTRPFDQIWRTCL